MSDEPKLRLAREEHSEDEDLNSRGKMSLLLLPIRDILNVFRLRLIATKNGVVAVLLGWIPKIMTFGTSICNQYTSLSVVLYE